MQYVPDRADLVWLDHNPQAGHEQAGRRPAVVLSPRVYNERAGLAICCPITSRAKGYPFEVPLPDGCGATGVVLADQLRSLDWIARRAERLGAVDTSLMAHITDLIAPLLDL
ncbi:MAG: endoribonuclease MazF [Candidatus Eremiobacteraeota bacterium]|nr:endoribonuclease MazF [Candidatus Eremiobacteraeota bacterium]